MGIQMSTSTNDPRGSLSILEFCQTENICKTSYYKMRRQGVGPEESLIPGTSIIRISMEAHDAWRERMKALGATKAAALERERRQRSASEAAKIAAVSPHHISRKKTRRANVRVRTNSRTKGAVR